MPSASAVLSSLSVERVRQALERAGLRADILELPGAARTARAAADFLSCDVGQIANSLAKADADFVRRHTGFVIGGVAPTAHDISTVYFDELLRLTNGVPAELAA
jgi:prolyl-tRNA editing enzyme YbaK/EbsC (Cys-tRNA(Pro) deacylase)